VLIGTIGMKNKVKNRFTDRTDWAHVRPQRRHRAVKMALVETLFRKPKMINMRTASGIREVGGRAAMPHRQWAIRPLHEPRTGANPWTVVRPVRESR